MRLTQSRPLLLLAASLSLGLAGCAGCGGDLVLDGDGGITSADGGKLNPDGGACQNLECFQAACPATSTTLTGTVFAPNGTLPLPNVTVYVPNAPVEALPAGLTCDRCGGILSGKPLVQTTTDIEGKFILRNVPATSNVPLVIQVGKWRRQITVPNVPRCTETSLATTTTRLPKNRSEGDIPKMALSTGSADALECLVRKIGLDDSEIGTENDPQRVHFYAGNGTATFKTGSKPFAVASTRLWNSLDNLKRYDVVMLSCEGGENPGNKDTSLPYMVDYAAAGGRVFGSHWHRYWVRAAAANTLWPATATWVDLADLNSIVADINTGFDKGSSLAGWLVKVGGSTTQGKISLTAAQHTVQAVGPNAQRWIYQDVTTNGIPSVQYMSFTTPLTVPSAQRCGRVVLSDIHVSSGDSSASTTLFPDGCTSGSALSPQEKVLAFMMFDIASCVSGEIN